MLLNLLVPASVHVLATSEWNQLWFEAGTFAAAMISFGCVAFLSHRSVRVLRKSHRFRLLDFLVAVTLICALAGLITGMAGEEKYGMPGKWRGKSGIPSKNYGNTERMAR